MTPRFRRKWMPLLGGMAAALVVGALVVALLVRTQPGRERILAYTLQTLGGRLNGELVVARLEGNLFTGARLYEVVLRDNRNQPLAVADSAFISYKLPSFFGGDVAIDDLVVYDAELLLYRLPSDSLWNYQQVLLDTTGTRAAAARATIIDRMRLVNTIAMIRLPWEPDEDLSEREQRREIAAALSDTSRLMVERVPDGYLRTVFIRTPEAEVRDLAVAPNERGGTHLRLIDANGLVQLYGDIPIRVEGLSGALSLRDGVLRYRAPTIVLPDSRLESSGVIDLRGEEPAYDVRVVGEEVTSEDMQWLYPAFPDEGRAEFVMWLETRPDGLLLRMRDLEFATSDTRIRGRFGLVFGDTLLFSDVALTASPLEVRTIERMLPQRIPVRGLQIGSVEIRSPAS